LDLQRNSIGSDGAKALAEALKTNSILTTLHLSFNSIGDNGAKALAEALKTNSTLTITGVSGLQGSGWVHKGRDLVEYLSGP
jgi:Ran GTPase-activating protein (RanGAP) involved in mRNA processing and transport